MKWMGEVIETGLHNLAWVWTCWSIGCGYPVGEMDAQQWPGERFPHQVGSWSGSPGCGNT